MPTDPQLRPRLLAGETLLGTFLGLGSPAATDLCARAGFDWLLVDLEHGVVGEADLLPHLLAIAGSGTTALVRVEQGTRLRIGRALDLGADGVMVPQVSSADEARDIVSWVRYPPVGRRGIALSTRGLGYGRGGHGSVGPRSEELTCIVQVESRAALDQVEAIAAVDGVDAIFVGPTDLSHALGAPGQLGHPDYQAAIERIARAARAYGKACGVLLWKPEDATRYVELGYTFFSVSSDVPLLDRAVKDGLSAVRATVEAARG